MAGAVLRLASVIPKKWLNLHNFLDFVTRSPSLRSRRHSVLPILKN